MSAPRPAESDPVPVVEKDGVVTLTLNRPQSFNALSESMLAALQRRIDDVSQDSRARVVVIAAAGKAFCAGHDLKEMRAQPDRDYYEDLFRRCCALMRSIVESPLPVIARVQGLATAAGCQLVAACDLAVASEAARFAVSGVNVGLFCSTPGVALSRNVAAKRAFEMLVTGEFIDSGTAARWGLINRVVPESELDEAVAKLAESIVSKPRVAVETGKRMFYRQLEMDLEAAYSFAASVMADNMMAEDTTEGVDAFVNKRAPSWRRS